jgi:hypothetical protein
VAIKAGKEKEVGGSARAEREREGERESGRKGKEGKAGSKGVASTALSLPRSQN